MMESLRYTYDIRGPPFVLWSKLYAFKRRDGEQIEAFKIKLQDKVQELLELDRAQNEPMVKLVIWNKIRDELSETLQWHIDARYNQDTMEEAMREINRWIANHPTLHTLTHTHTLILIKNQNATIPRALYFLKDYSITLHKDKSPCYILS